MPSQRLFEEEDFVFTISDNDVLSSEAEAEAESESEFPHIDHVKSLSKKRKRTADATNSSKSSKKSKVKTTDEDTAELGAEDQGVEDGAIASDFEFDFGPADTSDPLETFDAWGANDETLQIQAIKPTKKAVDVDEIIARRAERKKKAGKAQLELEAVGQVTAEAEDSSHQDDVDHDEIDFDDEALADDAFGATAESEEEDISPDVQHAHGSHEDDDNDDNDDSDDASIASPVAHPDDLGSDASDNESQSSYEDVEEAAKRKAFFANDDEHNQPPLSMAESFHQFSLSRPILRALAALNFSSPTPIQIRTIPVALQGLDVVGSAQTGSGKTAAFLLPILERLLYRPRKIPTTRVAILMPTRELAVQCYSVALALARFTDITFAQVVGGFSLRDQEIILKKRPDVVIATPGRFIDHMRNSASFTVENLEILVLDEADRMLEQGFTDELDEILKTIPRSRQTMLFSATMTSSVDKLVRVGMNKPVRLSIDSTHSTVAGLTQEFLRLRPGRDTPEMRLATLCTLVTTVPDYQQRTIVFFRQKKEAHRVRIMFGLLGVKAGELHGSMTQDQRIAAVNNFRDGKTTHLLATDVASRGLDIKNVLSIINYEAPQTHEIYLHRVGRTARAGKSGKSCTLASEPDRKVVKSAVKSARDQGAKVASRILDQSAVNAMDQQLEGFADEIEEILKEEKEEKQLAQMESEVQRGQNIVKYQDEILSRPKRTWFESEREKQANKDRAKAELNGALFKGEKKKLSNKDKKKLDLGRARKEERQWKKGKDNSSTAATKSKSKFKKASQGKTRSNGKQKPRK